MASIQCLVVAAAFMAASVMVNANQCLIGGECPRDDEPSNVVSMLQTKFRMNVLDVSDEQKGAGPTADAEKLAGTEASLIQLGEKHSASKGISLISSAQKAAPEKGAAEKAAPEKAAPEKGIAEKATLEKAAPEKGIAEKAAPQKAASDESDADKSAPLKAVSKKAAAEKAAPEKDIAEKAAPEKVAPEENAADKTAPLNAVSKKAAPEKAAPEKGIAEKASPKKSAPEENATDTTAPLNVVSKQAAPEEAAHENGIAEKAAPEKAASEENVVDKVAPLNAVSKKAAPEKAAPEKDIAEKAAPEKVAPEKVATEKNTAETASSSAFFWQMSREEQKTVAWYSVVYVVFGLLVAMVFSQFRDKYFVSKPVPESASDLSAEGFKFPLFGCFSDLKLCALGCFCPCLAWANTLDQRRVLSYWPAFFAFFGLMLLNMYTAGVASLFMIGIGVYYRQKVRENPSGGSCSLIMDILSWTFCQPCAIIQEAREDATVETPTITNAQ